MKKALLHIILWVCVVMSVIGFCYIILDYKSETDLLSKYNQVGTQRGDNTMGMKKLNFLSTYINETGDYTLALDKGFSRYEQISSTGQQDNSNQQANGNPSGSQSNYNPNSVGGFTDALTDLSTGIEYSLWEPMGGGNGKPMFICFHGTETWSGEKVGFGVYNALLKDKLQINATIVIPHKTTGGSWRNMGTGDIDKFIDSVISEYGADPNNIFYYGFSYGAIDFTWIGSLYQWNGAILNDGGPNCRINTSICSSLRCLMVAETTAYNASAKSYHDDYANALGLSSDTYYYEHFHKCGGGNIHGHVNSACVAQNVSDLPFTGSWGTLYHGDTSERVALNCFGWALSKGVR